MLNVSHPLPFLCFTSAQFSPFLLQKGPPIGAWSCSRLLLVNNHYCLLRSVTKLNICFVQATYRPFLLILSILACALGHTLKWKWALQMIVQSDDCIHHWWPQRWHLHHDIKRTKLSISCSYTCADMLVPWIIGMHSAVSHSRCELHISVRKNLISWSKSALHCFSALPNHQFCLGDACRENRCSKFFFFFF